MKIAKYPAGETLVQKQYSDYDHHSEFVNARDFDNGLDLVGIAQAKEVTKSNRLMLPYIPYGRQDRSMPSMPHALKLYGKLLNTIGFQDILTIDPHSDVSEAVIDNLRVSSNVTLVQRAVGEFTAINLIVPDMGAAKKATDLTKYLTATGIRVNLCQATKRRDLETGAITSTELLDTLEAGLPVYVVDDICDGGRTFIEIAKLIDEAFFDLYLVVTHGIFSKGYAPLLQYYRRIFTTDSYRCPEEVQNDKVTRIQV